MYFFNNTLRAPQSRPELHDATALNNPETRTTTVHQLPVGGNWIGFECGRAVCPRVRELLLHLAEQGQSPGSRGTPLLTDLCLGRLLLLPDLGGGWSAPMGGV